MRAGVRGPAFSHPEGYLSEGGPRGLRRCWRGVLTGQKLLPPASDTKSRGSRAMGELASVRGGWEAGPTWDGTRRCHHHPVTPALPPQRPAGKKTLHFHFSSCPRWVWGSRGMPLLQVHPSRFRLDPAAAAGGKASAPQERRFGIPNPKILPSSPPVTGQKITPSPHGSHIHSAITQGRGQGPLKTDLLLGAEVRTPAGCVASRPRGEHFRGGHSGDRATGRPTAQRTTTGDPRLPAASVRKNCFVFSKETLSISSPRETGKTELKYQRHRNSLRLAGSEWPGAVASRWL